MYRTIDDLPIVCKLNLPEAAQRVYREAFNQAWRNAPQEQGRHRYAQNHAWIAVRERFERDRETGRWITRSAGVGTARKVANKEP